MSERKAVSFNNKALPKNIIFSVVAFGLNMLVSLFTTTYITNRFGSDIYGYVKLAHDFVNYATLFSVALNSMASRFIMLERVRGNADAASEYYSSIGLANLIMAAVFVLPFTVCVCFLDSFFEIPPAMVSEVKLTFAITFTSFLVLLSFSVFSNCYYLTNTLYISSVRQSQASILNFSLVLLLFFLFEPRISFVVTGALAASLFQALINWYYARKLTPDLVFRFSLFRREKVWRSLSSGIWNGITQLSQILTSGLDLLITNLFLGPVFMGYMSVAKTIPNLVASFNGTIGSVFCPNLMRLYAEGDTEGLKNACKSAMRFMCLFVSIPNAILFTMGKELFGIWVPAQPADMLHILAVLTLINSCISGPMQPIYQVFTITNKVKEASLVMIAYGVVNIICVYFALRFTNWGVYAISAISLAGALVVALGYHVPYSAKYIGLKKTAFVPEIAKSVLTLIIVILIGYVVKRFIEPSQGWVAWFAAAITTAILGFICNFMIVLSRKERQGLMEKVKSYLPGGSRA